MTNYLTKSTRFLLADAVIGRSALLSAVNDSDTARRMVIPVAVLGAGTFASAQTSTTGAGDAINIGAWIDSLFQAVTSVMNTAGPGLYKLLGVIGGFFFVWNRLRSLW